MITKEKNISKKNATYEEFRTEALRILQTEYINFKEFNEEVCNYLNSEDAIGRVRDCYERNDSARTAAWALDMLF